MNFLRFLINLITLAVVIGVILVLVALTSPVQTALVKWELNRPAGWSATIDEGAAKFGAVSLTNLTLQTQGARLTAPGVRLELPVLPALTGRKYQVKALVAKGWVLDLRKADLSFGDLAAAANPNGLPPALADAIVVLCGRFSAVRLGADVSIAHAELEGDVLWNSGKAQRKLHLTLNGGGLAAGKEGTFAVTAAAAAVSSDFIPESAATHGTLRVAMDSPRTFREAEFKTAVAASGGAFANQAAFTTDFIVTRAAAGERYRWQLDRGARELAAIDARFDAAARMLAGDWKADLADTDAGMLAGEHPLPAFALQGSGHFETDPRLDRVHAAGTARGHASHWAALLPEGDRWGTLALAADFDATAERGKLRVGRLAVKVAAAQPILDARLLQPFTVDLADGALQLAHPDQRCLDVTLRAVPLAWLPEILDGVAFSGGDLSGAFYARSDHGTFTLEPKEPFRARGVAVTNGNREVARHLDVTATLGIATGPDLQAWQLSPLLIASGGRQLAELRGTISHPIGGGVFANLAGTWKVDFAAIAAAHAVAGAEAFPMRSGSGDLAGTWSGAPELKSAFALEGRAPGQRLGGRLTFAGNSRGDVTFAGKVTLEAGGAKSALDLEGQRVDDAAGPRLDLRLTGERVVIEPLGEFGAAFAGLNGARAGAPWWGAWTGKISVSFDQARFQDRDFFHVQGAVAFDPQSVKLPELRLGFDEKDPSKSTILSGSVTFDPSARPRYHASFGAALDTVQAAQWFAVPGNKEDPIVAGKFKVAEQVTGEGDSLEELRANTHESYALSSSSAILRLLGTDVAAALPQPKDTAVSDVKDTAASVGHAVGTFLGAVRDANANRSMKLAKNTEAILEFANQVAEIGCDEFSVTAVQQPGGAFRLEHLTIVAPDERITGTGAIGAGPKDRWSSRSLDLDLQLAFRNRPARLLQGSGLLAPGQDRAGYAALPAPMHFHGTLSHIAESNWHDVLVKAALPPAPPRK